MCHQPSLEDSPVLKSFKSVISQQIKARWSLEELDVGSIDVYAVILDPRFKQTKCLDTLPVKDEIICHMALFSPLQPDKETLCGSDKHLSALDILLGPEEVSQEPTSHENELKSYMKEKPVPSNDDILSWWKANEHRYKQVANVAKEILCVPSTSAPAEQLF